MVPAGGCDACAGVPALLKDIYGKRTSMAPAGGFDACTGVPALLNDIYGEKRTSMVPAAGHDACASVPALLNDINGERTSMGPRAGARTNNFAKNQQSACGHDRTNRKKTGQRGLAGVWSLPFLGRGPLPGTSSRCHVYYRRGAVHTVCCPIGLPLVVVVHPQAPAIDGAWKRTGRGTAVKTIVCISGLTSDGQPLRWFQGTRRRVSEVAAACHRPKSPIGLRRDGRTPLGLAEEHSRVDVLTDLDAVKKPSVKRNHRRDSSKFRRR